VLGVLDGSRNHFGCGLVPPVARALRAVSTLLCGVGEGGKASRTGTEGILWGRCVSR
jgi:hypothetical protein